MSWFKDWFNTPYYHILYKNHNRLEAERLIGNCFRYLNLKAGQRALNLPCGKGRHAVFLNALGLDVTAADLSTRNIEAAKAFENPKLRFFVHDIREPLQQRYDVVFNLFTSLGYFESRRDDRRAIHNLATAVNEEGRLLIDFMNVEKVVTALVPHEVVERDGLCFHLSRNIRDGFVDKTIRFEDQGVAHHYEEHVRLLRYADFEDDLKPCGLRIQAVFGNYDLEPFDEKTSDRLLILAAR